MKWQLIENFQNFHNFQNFQWEEAHILRNIFKQQLENFLLHGSKVTCKKVVFLELLIEKFDCLAPMEIRQKYPAICKIWSRLLVVIE